VQQLAERAGVRVSVLTPRAARRWSGWRRSWPCPTSRRSTLVSRTASTRWRSRPSRR
jgi:hypothetical protein